MLQGIFCSGSLATSEKSFLNRMLSSPKTDYRALARKKAGTWPARHSIYSVALESAQIPLPRILAFIGYGPKGLDLDGLGGNSDGLTWEKILKKGAAAQPSPLPYHYLFTMLVSSRSRSSPSRLSTSLAAASRPFKIGNSKCFLNSWAVPKTRQKGKLKH